MDDHELGLFGESLGKHLENLPPHAINPNHPSYAKLESWLQTEDTEDAIKMLQKGWLTDYLR